MWFFCGLAKSATGQRISPNNPPPEILYHSEMSKAKTISATHCTDSTISLIKLNFPSLQLWLGSCIRTCDAVRVPEPR